MINVNFDRICFAVSRNGKNGKQTLVFVNLEGKPSQTSAVDSTYEAITKSHREGWRKIIGVYDQMATRQMVEDDLMFLGYRPE